MKKKAEISQTLCEKHAGVIVKLANKYWWKLPPHVRVSYDVEDMISELTVHLLKREVYFQRSRGATSTFAWTVVENFCWVIIKRETWQKRFTNGTVSLDIPRDEQSVEVLDALASLDQQQKLRESKKAVEQMIRFASDELREALSDLLTAHHYRLHRYCRREELQHEVQKIAKTHNVSIDDFRTVLSSLV